MRTIDVSHRRFSSLSSVPRKLLFFTSALLIVLLQTPTLGWAQWRPAGAVLVNAVDARSVALGESFVALPGGQFAFLSNPAGLADASGIQVSYAQRSYAYSDELRGSKHQAVQATVETPAGVIGIHYSRLTWGPLPAFYSDAFQVTNFTSLSERLVAIGIGRRVAGNLSLGIVGKYLDAAEEIEPPIPGISYGSSPAFLFDAGAIFAVPLESDEGEGTKQFTLGASVQNIGTRIETSTTIAGASVSGRAQMPEMLRLGAAVSVLPLQGVRLNPVGFVVTMQYRIVIAEQPSYSDRRPNWGFGLECTLFELLSLRFGGAIVPQASAYADPGEPGFRYGAGLNIPFQRLGSSIPLLIVANYAVVPLNGAASGSPGTISAFSFGAQIQI